MVMPTTSPTSSSQQARYGAIFDQAAGGLLLSDLNGRFLLVNQRWCDMLGYPMAEMLQLSIFDLTFPEDVAEAHRHLATLVSERASVDIEKRYRRKDGTGIWLSVSVSTVRDDAGNPESIMALAIDITERKATAALHAFLADLAEQLSPITDGRSLRARTYYRRSHRAPGASRVCRARCTVGAFARRAEEPGRARPSRYGIPRSRRH